jgi:hypothetical protein
MKRLLALLGIDARLRRVRSTFNEASLAAEDRAQLLRMAWDDEKARIKRLTGLVFALSALSLGVALLLSVAVVVHFWATPQREMAAWLVAGFWLVLWVAALIGLLVTLRGASLAIEPARRELMRDWEWMQSRFEGDGHDAKPREPRPATQRELLDRIERQRRRLMLEERLEAVAKAAAPEPAVASGRGKELSAALAVQLAKEHPIATGAVAAVVVAVIGPRRLVRTAGWLVPRVLPILWKLR